MLQDLGVANKYFDDDKQLGKAIQLLETRFDIGK